MTNTNQTNQNTQQTESTDRGFFNAILSGSGYINRMTRVTPKKGGDSYFSVTVCILSGKKDDPARNYINTIVRGSEALEFAKNNDSAITEAITNKVPVYGAFEIGDISCETYPKNNGEVGAKMMGRLIGINYLRIGSEIVHQRQKENAPSESAQPIEEENVSEEQAASSTAVKNEASKPAPSVTYGSTGGYGSPSVTFI